MPSPLHTLTLQKVTIFVQNEKYRNFMLLLKKNIYFFMLQSNSHFSFPLILAVYREPVQVGYWYTCTVTLLALYWQFGTVLEVAYLYWHSTVIILAS